MFPQYLSSSNQNCITSVVLESVSSALTFFICDFEKLIKLFSTSIMQLLMQVQFELRISGVTQGSNYVAGCKGFKQFSRYFCSLLKESKLTKGRARANSGCRALNSVKSSIKVFLDASVVGSSEAALPAPSGALDTT